MDDPTGYGNRMETGPIAREEKRRNRSTPRLRQRCGPFSHRSPSAAINPLIQATTNRPLPLLISSIWYLYTDDDDDDDVNDDDDNVY